jgi:hypothetical protein
MKKRRARMSALLADIIACEGSGQGSSADPVGGLGSRNVRYVHKVVGEAVAVERVTAGASHQRTRNLRRHLFAPLHIAYIHAIRARCRRYSVKSASVSVGNCARQAATKSRRAALKLATVPSALWPRCDAG